MRKLILTAALVAGPLALSGCVTAEEMAAQDSEDCHSYGAATGTDAYFQCRMVKSQQHIEASERTQAQIQQGLDIIAANHAPPPMETIVVAPGY
jgi:hypothetical protein